MTVKNIIQLFSRFLIIFCLAFLCSCSSIFQSKQQLKQVPEPKPLTLHTIYGDAQITEPLLISLLTSGAVERLKYVRQYGVIFYAIPEINANYSRYEHSIGVLFLLRRYKAPLIEQAAGLLHDASHTVFSHVGDFFKAPKNPKYSYQDEIHAWYLDKSGVGQILNNYGVTIDDVLITTGKNKMLKDENPNLCADCLEYILKAGILTNELTIDDIKTILNDVFYADERWYFGSIKNAKKFALISLFNTEHIWGGVANSLILQWTSDALKRAIEIKEITPEEINFSIDTVLWEKLTMSKDKKIQLLLHRIMNHKKYYTLSTKAKHTNHIHNKHRGIDPWVKVDNTYKRLTECDADFEREFDRVKKQVTQGWYITLAPEV